jgi:hypothetical protein
MYVLYLVLQSDPTKCLKHVVLPTGMSYVKIIDASQTHFQRYKNVRRKLYNCSANIFFNLECRPQNVC